MDADREEQMCVDIKVENKVVTGGIYYRDYDLAQFIHKVEASGKKFVGVGFDGSANLQILYLEPEAEEAASKPAP